MVSGYRCGASHPPDFADVTGEVVSIAAEVMECYGKHVAVQLLLWHRQLFGKTYILNPPRWLSMVPWQLLRGTPRRLDDDSMMTRRVRSEASRLAGGLMSKKSLEKAQ